MSLSKIKLIGILVAIGLIAYLPSLNNKFVWDDEQFIYNNSYVKNFEIKKIFSENTIAGAGESSSYYRPITTLSFAIDHQIWGLNPFGFHLTNTILHILAGTILFLFILNLGISKNKSFWVVAIFLSHPVQTEAVVYANSRGDSMYVFWSLLGLLTFSFLCIKKYPKLQIYNLVLKLSKAHLSLLTIIFYLLSILSKEIGIASLGLFFITFLAINLKEILREKLIHISKKILQIGTLFFLVVTSIFYLIFRNQFLNISISINAYDSQSPYGSSIYVRLHTFFRSLWEYFQFIFYPIKLHMERSLNIIEQPISIWLVATFVLIFFIFIIGYQELKKRKSILTWFGFSWFIMMLIPVSGISPINGLIYEHWLYMPIIGFSIFLLGTVETIFENKLNEFFKYFLPILIILYIILTIKQNYIWGNPIRFYEYTLKFSQTARLNNNLAMAYAEAGENLKAIDTYKKAIEISDFYPQTHHNLGNVYLSAGEVGLAELSFTKAISMNNSFLPSYVPLINIFIKEEKYDEALPLIKELANKIPENFKVRLLYADILYKTGEKQEAENLLSNLRTKYSNDQRAIYLIDKTVKEN